MSQNVVDFVKECFSGFKVHTGAMQYYFQHCVVHTVGGMRQRFPTTKSGLKEEILEACKAVIGGWVITDGIASVCLSRPVTFFEVVDVFRVDLCFNMAIPLEDPDFMDLFRGFVWKSERTQKVYIRDGCVLRSLKHVYFTIPANESGPGVFTLIDAVPRIATMNQVLGYLNQMDKRGNIQTVSNEQVPANDISVVFKQPVIIETKPPGIIQSYRVKSIFFVCAKTVNSPPVQAPEIQVNDGSSKGASVQARQLNIQEQQAQESPGKAKRAHAGPDGDLASKRQHGTSPDEFVFGSNKDIKLKLGGESPFVCFGDTYYRISGVHLLYGKTASETVSRQERALHESLRQLMHFKHSIENHAVYFPVPADIEIMGMSGVKEVRIPYDPIAMTDAEVVAAIGNA
jgi:hypothetical protein